MGCAAREVERLKFQHRRRSCAKGLRYGFKKLSRNSKTAVPAEERRYKSFELKKCGKSYRDIQKELGISQTMARKDVMRVLRDMRPPQEDVEYHRKMLVTRYEFLLERLFEALESSPDSANATYDRILKTLNQIADVTSTKEKAPVADNQNNDLAVFADMLKQACLQ